MRNIIEEIAAKSVPYAKHDDRFWLTDEEYAKKYGQMPTEQVTHPKPVMCTMSYYVDGNLMETICYQDGTDETRVVRYKPDSVEVPIKKVGDNEWVGDISGLSEEDKRILIERLRASDETS